MSYKFIVIYSLPRSGTSYMSQVLNRCGMDVHFETEPELGPAGLVSWGAINHPSLAMRDDCALLHQIRDPIKQIRSFAEHNAGNTTFDNMPRVWESLDDVQRENLLAFRRARDGYLVFNQIWNQRIEDAIETRTNYYKTYRVEDVDKEFIVELFQLLDLPCDEGKVESALKNQPRDTNKKPVKIRQPIHYDWKNFAESAHLVACKERASKHGYL